MDSVPSFNGPKNIRLGMAFSFSWMFLPVIPVIVPYVLSLGFSMTEFLQLQAIFGLAVAVFEVPSGYAADLFGRKRVMVLGSALSALGFAYLCVSESFLDFVFYQVLVALGLALTSGADLSLLYDSKNAMDEQKEEQVSSGSTMLSHFFFYRLLAEAFSAALGGLLATISYPAVLITTALTAWLPVGVGCLLSEPPVHKAELTTHLENFKRVFHQIFVESALLRLLFINFVIWSLATFCAVWLIQKYWDEAGLSLMWFGILWAVFQVVAGVTGIWAARLEKTWEVRKLLAASMAFIVFGYLGLGLLPTSLGVFIGVLFYLGRGFNSVLYSEAINARISGEFRATINSLYGLSFRLAFMVVGPLIGLAIDRFGASLSFVGLSASFSVLGVLLFGPLYFKWRQVSGEILAKTQTHSSPS